jgi:DSF synthase
MALSTRQTPDGPARPEIQAGAAHKIAHIESFPGRHDRRRDRHRDNVVSLDLHDLEGQSDALEVRFEADQGSLWCAFNHGERPCFTPELLEAIRQLQTRLQRSLVSRSAPTVAVAAGSQGRPATGGRPPLRSLIWTSTVPGIWNLGGDLKLFVELIRARAETELRHYAHACVDVVYRNLSKLDLPLLTIALVQGDALGGGFEAVLTNDVIIAERDSKFGLPEILFNMFPGMGAYSLLCRRLDGCRAQQLILSGRLYEAEELERMGLVDLVVEPGQGEAAVREYLARNERRHAVLRALSEVRRRCQPVSYDELIEVTELWVTTALGLDEADLRRMERLAAAQQRRRERAQETAEPPLWLSAAG